MPKLTALECEDLIPRKLLYGLLLAGCLSLQSAAADEEDPFSLGWLIFGDVYTMPSHHTAEGDGASGVVIRRGYLTANFDIGENWWGRARIEVNQDGEFESYGFEAEFKDLYLARNFGAHEWIFGLSPTLTFDLIESIWDARYLMRTPMDLQGVASRDTGIAIRGPIGDSQFSYRLMGATGSEFGAESGDGRKWMAALNWTSQSGIEVDLYTDFEKLAGPTDRTTAQVFVGQETETLRWGRTVLLPGPRRGSCPGARIRFHRPLGQRQDECDRPYGLDPGAEPEGRQHLLHPVRPVGTGQDVPFRDRVPLQRQVQADAEHDLDPLRR